MTKGHPTNNCSKTSTCWRTSESMLIYGRWLIKGLLPSFTTVAKSWRQTGKVLTKSWMLSEKGLIHWQQQRSECYPELGTFQIYENSIHNVERKSSELY
ncbi:hypothetical protein GW17_00050634 [Ensete ventricosum]|nr:hypothetical protein GW17_00050634 [Ensete ventricosum]